MQSAPQLLLPRSCVSLQLMLHVLPPILFSVLHGDNYNPETIKARGCGGTGESGKPHPCSPTVTDMKFISIVALLAAPFAVSATRIGWAAYDNGEQSLNTVACSNGPNGLVTRGYSVFKDLPTFPNISGSSLVTWNSPLCGSLHFTKLDLVMDTRGSRYNRFLLECHLQWRDSHGDGG